MDPQGPRRAEEARRARRLLRHRHHGLALPGPGAADGRRGPRGRPAHLQPPRPLLPVQRAASTGSCPRTSWRSRAPPASAPRCSGRRTPRSPTPWTTSPGRSPQYIGSRGYITVVNNTDSEDWKRPGVDEIIRAGHAQGRQGRDRPDARLRRRPLADRRGARPLPAADCRRRGYEFDQPHRGARRAQRAHPGHRPRAVEGQGLRLRGRRSPSNITERPGRRPRGRSASWSSPASA